MSLKVQAAKNIASNWFGLGVSITTGFLLSPFILHKLGDEAYGLWILSFSLTGYYGLFDLGIRSSIIRYVSKFTATSDRDQLVRLINTTLFSYSCIAVLLLLLTGLGSWYVGLLFRIPTPFLRTARILFLMVGWALAIGLPLSVFGGVLEGLQKFYLLNLTQVISNLLRALLIVITLNCGRGLLTVAFITVALPVLTSLAYGAIVHRLLNLRYARSLMDRASLQKVLNYGSATFMIIVASKLRFRTDAVVIGIFLSSAAITFFSIASKLVDYSTEIVQSMAQVFTPMSSHYDGVGDLDRLRSIFVAGNRASALVMFPISAALIVLGRSVIEVWVGVKYVSSYNVLLILLVPHTLHHAQAASTKILFGLGRHRALAVVALVEGIANIALSIALIRPFGIVGDAVGTAIPLLCTSLFFLPRCLCKLLNIRLGEFLRQAYLLPLGLCAPFVAALLFLQHLFQAHTYGQLSLQLVAAGLVYGVGLLWFFLTREPAGVKLRARFGHRLR